MEIKTANFIQREVTLEKSAKSPELPKPVSSGTQAVAETKPKATPVVEQATAQNKAVFALQDDRYLVIQVLDTQGKVVRQIPPKELIAAYEQLRESMQSSQDRGEA